MFRLITPSVDIVQHFLKHTGLLSGLIYVGTYIHKIKTPILQILSLFWYLETRHY